MEVPEILTAEDCSAADGAVMREGVIHAIVWPEWPAAAESDAWLREANWRS